MKKESSGARTIPMKPKSSGAGARAMLMNRRVPGPELCHFHDGSAALVRTVAWRFATYNVELVAAIAEST